jgi:hypothetical protein
VAFFRKTTTMALRSLLLNKRPILRPSRSCHKDDQQAVQRPLAVLPADGDGGNVDDDTVPAATPTAKPRQGRKAGQL